MTRPRTIAVDIDGVIYKAAVWSPKLSLLGDLMPGCVEELQKFKNNGWDIVIHTARHPVQFNDIELCLVRDRIPYDRFWRGQGKPLADVYLDDRAVTFEGEWNGIFHHIDEVWKPWLGDKFVRPSPGSVDEELIKDR